MAVIFTNITRQSFLKDSKFIYRYTNLERFIESLNSNSFAFINPTKWADPFEKFYLDRDFKIKDNIFKLPAKDRLFSVCISGTLSSEAFWKVYAPKEDGIRLSIDTEKFLTLFLDQIKDCDVYVGKVQYQTTKEFFKIAFDKKKLIKEIQENKIGDQQIRLLLKKRNSFLYENEYRIIVVPHKKQKETTVYKVETLISQFITSYTIDPRMGKNQVKVLKEYFSEKRGLKISHSTLYSEKRREPIVLS